MPIVLALLLMLAPLVLGITLIVLGRRRGLGHPACGRCRYDVTGSVGSVDRCPECGVLFVEGGIFPPKGRRRSGMQVTGVVLVVLGLGCLGSSVLTSVGLMQARKAQSRAMQAQTQAQTQAQQAQQAQPQPADGP